MSGFETPTSGVGSDHSTNCVTIPFLYYFFLCLLCSTSMIVFLSVRCLCVFIVLCLIDLFFFSLPLFVKWAIPRLFFVYFRLFSNKHQFNFTTNVSEKCQSNTQCSHSNPRPSGHESPPVTTRPGLPPVTLPLLVFYSAIFLSFSTSSFVFY